MHSTSDDQRVDHRQTMALRVDDDRIEVDFLDQLGMVGGETRQIRDQLGERFTIGRRRPSNSTKERRSPQLVEQSERLLLPDWHRRKGGVPQHLHVDSANADHQHRAEDRVPRDAENDFTPRRCHRLHQDAIDHRFGVSPFRAPQHPLIGLADGAFADNAERDAARLGLVGNVGRLDRKSVV